MRVDTRDLAEANFGNNCFNVNKYIFSLIFWVQTCIKGVFLPLICFVEKDWCLAPVYRDVLLQLSEMFSSENVHVWWINFQVSYFFFFCGDDKESKIYVEMREYVGTWVKIPSRKKRLIKGSFPGLVTFFWTLPENICCWYKAFVLLLYKIILTVRKSCLTASGIYQSAANELHRSNTHNRQ